MSDLRDLPNIGKVAEANLIQAGIDTPQKLSQVGSRAAFIRVREIDAGA